MYYTFELKELQAEHIVFLHHQGDMNQIPNTIGKLLRWAGPRGLMANAENKLVSIYQQEEKGMSTDIGITVSAEMEGDGEISKGVLPDGLYAIGHFEIGIGEIPTAWSLMYTLTSKHQCKPRPGKTFEVYQSNPDQHPEGKCKVDLCIPVQMVDLSTMEKKAGSLLAECDTVMLASVTEDGCPRPVPMGKIKADGISRIWFSTGTFSDKTIQFQINPKAGVCFMKGGDSIVLTGKVEIVSDMETKTALWSDWMFAHFPGGVTDPNYCILMFTSENATYWIDNEFVKAKVPSLSPFSR